MKKEWKIPRMVVERFTPNEYVSSCADGEIKYLFTCDAGESKLYYSIEDANGNGLQVTQNNNLVDVYGGASRDTSYKPCGKTHETSMSYNYITGYFLDAVKTTNVNEHIPVIIWIDDDKDVHCTKNVQINSWQKNQS